VKLRGEKEGGRDRVLITGISGLVGRVLRWALADDYVVSGIDVRRIRGINSRVGNMAKMKTVRGAFDGVDLVIDLAADANPLTSWERVYNNNVPATVNALEASRLAGVKRVVFASSNHVTGMYEKDPPYSAIAAGNYDGLDPSSIPYITTDFAVRPDGPYGAGKAFGEAAARYYADEFGLSVICLRIGTVNEESRPRSPRHFATLLTHGDLVRLVRCSLQAPTELTFEIFYGVSNNTWRFWDIEDSREAIGYQPQDDAEAWRRGIMEGA
jgi:nucleoside-diphosphate-sugar epimerase